MIVPTEIELLTLCDKMNAPRIFPRIGDPVNEAPNDIPKRMSRKNFISCPNGCKLGCVQSNGGGSPCKASADSVGSMNCYFCSLCEFQWQQNNPREIKRIIKEWFTAHPEIIDGVVPCDVLKTALDVRPTKRKTTEESYNTRMPYKCAQCGHNKRECGHFQVGFYKDASPGESVPKVVKKQKRTMSVGSLDVTEKYGDPVELKKKLLDHVRCCQNYKCSTCKKLRILVFNKVEEKKKEEQEKKVEEK